MADKRVAQIKRKRHKEFVLQWHITDKCEMRCKHCYIPDVMKHKDIQPDIPANVVISRLAEFSEHLKRWEIKGRVNFSGGNPILHPDYFDIMSATRKLGYQVGILGNPTSVLNPEVRQKLKENGIFRYQISLDGLKDNHEKIRGPDSFDLAMRGLEALVADNIPAVVMNTVTSENLGDLPKLTRLVYDKGVESFAFARLVPIGDGEDLAHLMPTPKQFRQLISDMYEVYMEIYNEKGIKIPLKDPLWRLFFHENGLLHPGLVSDDYIFVGCGVGIASLSINVNGDTYSCRRLEIPIGNIYNQSIRDIFITSSTMKEHRDFKAIDDCGECEIMSACRGCRAVANAVNGNYFAKDPQCWRANPDNSLSGYGK